MPRQLPERRPHLPPVDGLLDRESGKRDQGEEQREREVVRRRPGRFELLRRRKEEAPPSERVQINLSVVAAASNTLNYPGDAVHHASDRPPQESRQRDPRRSPTASSFVLPPPQRVECQVQNLAGNTTGSHEQPVGVVGAHDRRGARCPFFLVRSGARCCRRGDLGPVRRDIERQQEERDRRARRVEHAEQGQETGGGEAVGDHVEDGAEVAGLAEEAGEPAVELVADEAVERC